MLVDYQDQPVYNNKIIRNGYSLSLIKIFGEKSFIEKCEEITIDPHLICVPNNLKLFRLLL